MIEKNPEHIAGHCFLTAALAMADNLAEASTAGDRLLRVHAGFSVNSMLENHPFNGEMADRLGEGLRKAGIPER